MAVIGWNTIGVNSETVGAWNSECWADVGYTYTAVSGDVVTEMAFHSGGATGNAEMAIYTINTGISPRYPVTMVGSAVTVPYNTTAQWYTASCSIALTAGVTYGVALRYSTSGGGNLMRWSAGDATPVQANGPAISSALPSTWSGSGFDFGKVSYYATVTAGGSGAVVGVITATSPAATSVLVGTSVAPPGDRAGPIVATGPVATAVMAGVVVNPGVTYTDNFNRADSVYPPVAGNLGANWNTLANSWFISSNKLTKVAGDHYTRWVAPMPSPDHYVEVDLERAMISNYMWMHIRATTNTPGTVVPLASYEGGINTTAGGGGISEAEVGIVHADGTYTVLARGATNYGNSDPIVRCRLEAVGNKIRFYTNGNLVCEGTDSELSGSYVGLNCFAGSTGIVFYENFQAGTIVAAIPGIITATGPSATSVMAGTVTATSTKYLNPAVGIVSTPDLVIPASFHIIAYVRKTAVPSGGNAYVAAQSGGAGNIGWWYGVAAAGANEFGFSTTGATVTGGKAVSGAPTAGIDDWFGFLLDRPGGATHTYNGLASADGATWTVAGGGGTIASAFTFFDSTAAITIGALIDGTTAQWDGRIYWVEMRTGITVGSGTVVWRFDADEWTSGTSYTDPRGLTWTLSTAGAIVLPGAEFNGRFTATGPSATSVMVGTWVPTGVTGTIVTTGPRATSVMVGTFTTPPSGGGTMGYNVIGASVDPTSSTWNAEAIVAAAYRYTAGTGEAVTQFNVYGSGDGTCEMAVYVWNGTVPTTRVGSPTTVTIGAALGWHTQAVNIALTPGVTYVVAIDYFQTDSWFSYYNLLGGTTTSAGAFDLSATTWPQSSTTGYANSYYATVAAATPPINGVFTATGPSAVSVVSGTAVSGIDRSGTFGAIGPRATAVMVGTYTGPTFTNRYATAIAGRKIVDQAGSVYLLRTFSSWAMAQNLTNAEITQALEGLAARGFNGATICYGGGIDFGGWHRYTNAAGQLFWTGQPWASTFGPGWSSVDWCVSECDRLGLTISLSMFYSWGVNGAAGDFAGSTTLTQAYNVGYQMASRYLSYTNIVWHMMFDRPDVDQAHVDALFHGINDAEGIGRRPVRWAEPNQTENTYQHIIQRGYSHFNVTLNGMYWYLSNSAELMEASYNQAGATTMPTGDVEPPYDGSAPYNAGADPQGLRERSWAVFLEGGQYINYGNENWWVFGQANPFFPTEGLTWQQVITDPHTVQQSYIWPVIDTYAADHQWAPTADWLTTGQGSGDTKAAVGRSNVAAVAYFPSNSGRTTVTIDTTPLNGTTCRIRWYDPYNGTYATVTANETQQTGRVITYPSGNHGDSGATSDWVLIVDSPDRGGVITAVGPRAISNLQGTVSGGVGAKVKVGATTPTSVKVGTTTVTGIYVGPTRVWP